ncbi:MAG TPA: LssY C-terminal domain-containing protein, partial [Roseiarcus sp.]|nr:LssY C-terminal domain-containing protein [Roseiarcus sp.]
MTMPNLRQEAGRRSLLRRGALVIVILAAAYLALAYGLIPAAWRHHERQKGLDALPMTTATSLGIQSDALNVGLEGSEEDVICAMEAAGWSPADPVTLKSSLKIAGSVLFDRPYLQAPVSNLFYQSRREDLAFEKAAGRSADTRHHVRFWKVLDAGDDGLPVWLGAATFDRGVGVSHYTGQITHHIAPDIDAERDLISADLAAAGKVDAAY